MRALLEQGRYRLAIEAGAGGVRALALVALFPEEAFAHLDYIATAHAERRRGVATGVIEFLLAEARHSGLDALTLETEDPMVPFYARRGARILGGLRYMFPSPSVGPMPMHLMAFPLAGQHELGRDRVARIVTALYRALHRRPEPDAVLDSILERIPERVSLSG